MKINQVNIGLSDPKNPANVGSILRTAGNFRVDNVFYTGTRYDRARLQNQTQNISRKVSRHVHCEKVDNLLTELDKNTRIVCVELAQNATPLPDYQHPEQAIYIFGPEDGSLSQDIIDQADDIVYIPTVDCMNLAITVSVVMYDRLAKSRLNIDHNDLIKRSRDTNNNLIVKN